MRARAFHRNQHARAPCPARHARHGPNRCIDPGDINGTSRGASMTSLVICLDGTWNNADSAEHQTNIGLLASMIDPKPLLGVPAHIYYDAGVGTSGSHTHRLAGGLLGTGLSTNILEAYRFLSLNYRPGDDIYIFGYSRGAYTARSLCGFLAASGLLRADMCDAAQPGVRLDLLPHQAQEALPGRQGAAAPHHAPGSARALPRRVRHGGLARHPAHLAQLDGPALLPVPRYRHMRHRRPRLPCAGHRRAPHGVRGVGVAPAAASRLPDGGAGVVSRRARQRRWRLRVPRAVRPDARLDDQAPAQVLPRGGGVHGGPASPTTTAPCTSRATGSTGAASGGR